MPSTALVATIGLNPDVIDDDVDITPLLNLLNDPTPVLQAAGAVMAGYQEQAFEQGGAPWGNSWPALTERTLREKERLGFPLQSEVRTGLLQSQIGATQEVGDDEVTTGIDLNLVPYAAAQDAGVEEHNLPARWLVSVNEDEMDELQQTIDDYLSEAGLPAGAITVTITNVSFGE